MYSLHSVPLVFMVPDVKYSEHATLFEDSYYISGQDPFGKEVSLAGKCSRNENIPIRVPNNKFVIQ